MLDPDVDAVEYAEGFNQGMQAAAQRFELYIMVLAALFAVRIVIKLPFVRSRLEDLPYMNWFDAVDTGTDVLSFFVVVILMHAVLGAPILDV